MTVDVFVARYRTSLVLGSCWVVSAVGLAALPEATADRLLLRASTTLPRVAAWPWTLPLSGLLAKEDLVVPLLALVLGVAPLEAQVGWRRTLLLLAVAHSGATALSQGLLGVRVAVGAAPAHLLSSVDVGPSYLAVAGLAAAGAVAPTPARRLLALAALAVGLPELMEGLQCAEVPAVGHLCAGVLGLAGGWLLRSP